MLPYWLLFGSAALGSLIYNQQDRQRKFHLGLALMALVTALMIGLRYKVGADWDNYLFIYNDAGHHSFLKAIGFGDPLYQALNWYGQQIGVRIWFVNLVCGLCFGWGLYRFSRLYSNPWTTVAIAITYLGIVVAMGYTRQGAAMGFVLAALADYLKTEKIWRFSLLVFIGALFHSSAVVVFPLVALTGHRTRMVNLAVVLAACFLSYKAFVTPALDKVQQVYLNPAYSSQGAFVRVGLDVAAGLGFFVFRPYLTFTPLERSLWRNFSFAAFAAMIALALVSSSTIVDRLALYILPLQLAVFTRLSEFGGRRISAQVSVLALFAAVQFTWLNFGANSRLWEPYRMYWLSE